MQMAWCRACHNDTETVFTRPLQLNSEMEAEARWQFSRVHVEQSQRASKCSGDDNVTPPLSANSTGTVHYPMLGLSEEDGIRSIGNLCGDVGVSGGAGAEPSS